MPRILLFFLRHGPVTVAVFLTPNAKPRNLTELCIMIDSVHDSVRAKNDLANIFFLYSGTMRPNPGIHVVSYSGRPDQFVSHEAIIGALPDDCSLEEIAEHVFRKCYTATLFGNGLTIRIPTRSTLPVNISRA